MVIFVIQLQVMNEIEDLMEQLAIGTEKQQTRKQQKSALEKELDSLNTSIKAATTDCLDTKAFLMEKFEISQEDIDKMDREQCTPGVVPKDSAEVNQAIRRARDTKRYWKYANQP
jgi:hypothetical protein